MSLPLQILQDELCVNFQRIREIEIEKMVYVNTYNILPHLGPPVLGYSLSNHSREYCEARPQYVGPRVLDYSLTDHSREYWEALPQYLGPRVLGNVH